MKTCPFCHHDYPDEETLCSICGSKLEEKEVPAPPAPQKRDVSLPDWLGLALVIFSFIVSWEISIYLGLALAIVGIAITSKTDRFKIGTYVAGGFSVLLSTIFIFLLK